MRKQAVIILTLVMSFSATWLLSCASDSDKAPNQPGQEGEITTSVDHITGRSGDFLMSAVYDKSIDWTPGASNDLIVSSIIVPIDSDDFSFSHIMQEMDSLGQETGVEKTFAAGTYSVLFFVGESNNPPDTYAEIRATVDGDINVEAPPWGSW
ncbi:hypothetical protein KKA00_06950 [bacterium]|nr:hypothetical protein [bacterium]MBU1651941.1 hypothetical protein [bacterium]